MVLGKGIVGIAKTQRVGVKKAEYSSKSVGNFAKVI
jgi:hypothetical protein